MTTMSDWCKDKVGIVLWLPREHYKTYLQYLLDSVEEWNVADREFGYMNEGEIYDRLVAELEGALKEEPDDTPVTRFALPDDQLFPEPDDDNDRSGASDEWPIVPS